MLAHIKKVMTFSLLSLLAACSNTNVDTKDISQKNFIAKLERSENVVVLDVRSVEEFKEGHIPNAINIPHNEIEDRLPELNDLKDSDIVVYCKTGRRAAFSYEILANNGFGRIEHLDGDFSAWQENGSPIAKGSQ